MFLKIIFKLVLKIVVGDYDFNFFKFITVVNNYGFNLQKFKTIIINYDSNEDTLV